MFTEFEAVYKENRLVLQKTKEGYHPLCSSEVGKYHNGIVKGMLEDLNPNTPEFDNEFNQIIFGSIVIELVIETDKYFIKGILHEKTMDDLMRLCETEAIPNLRYGSIPLREKVLCEFTKQVGKHVLDGNVEFSQEHIDSHQKRSLEFLQNHTSMDIKAVKDRREIFYKFLGDRCSQYLLASSTRQECP